MPTPAGVEHFKDASSSSYLLPMKKYYIADCDFTDLNSVNNVGNEIIEFTQGNIYALINNAAVQNPSGRAWEVNWEDVENNLKINL